MRAISTVPVQSVSLVCAFIPNQVIETTISMVPVQRVSLVHADALKQITEIRIPLAPVQSLTSMCLFPKSELRLRLLHLLQWM